ncbi:hypothetical protein HK104_010618 [Borealophlyctis nickersoniae]|nr:hypothetical protein HK104_010618 [Borealophlyctis nickersoniae]
MNQNHYSLVDGDAAVSKPEGTKCTFPRMSAPIATALKYSYRNALLLFNLCADQLYLKPDADFGEYIYNHLYWKEWSTTTFRTLAPSTFALLSACLATVSPPDPEPPLLTHLFSGNWYTGEYHSFNMYPTVLQPNLTDFGVGDRLLYVEHNEPLPGESHTTLLFHALDVHSRLFVGTVRWRVTLPSESTLIDVEHFPSLFEYEEVDSCIAERCRRLRYWGCTVVRDVRGAGGEVVLRKGEEVERVVLTLWEDFTADVRVWVHGCGDGDGDEDGDGDGQGGLVEDERPDVKMKVDLHAVHWEQVLD